MKKGCMIALGAVLVLIIVVAVAVWVADARYGLIRRAPRIPYTEVVEPTTRVSLVFTPELAEPYFGALFPRSLANRLWLVDKLLPYETVLAFAPHPDDAAVEVLMFFNEKRLGPVIADRLNRQALLRQWQAVAWNPPAFIRAKPGMLVAKGTMPMPEAIQDTAWAVWGGADKLPLLKTEGGHLFEVVLDNHDGGAFVVLASLLSANGQDTEGWLRPETIELAKNVAEARLFADPVSADALRVRIRVVCYEDTNTFLVAQVNMQFQQWFEMLRQRLADDFDVELTGASERHGTTIEGDYTLSNLEPLFRQLALQH